MAETTNTTPATTQGQPTIANNGQAIPLPNGQQVTIQVNPGDRVLIAFDPSTAEVTRVGDDLVLKFEDGGQITLAGFAAAAEGANPPSIMLPDGQTVIAGDVLVAQLGDGDPTDLETAAGGDAGGGGGSSYSDDFGNTIDPFGAQGPLDPTPFPISLPDPDETQDPFEPVSVSDRTIFLKEDTILMDGNDLHPDGSDLVVANSSVGTFISEYGAITINADGTFSFDLDNSVDGDGTNIVQRLAEGETVTLRSEIDFVDPVTGETHTQNIDIVIESVNDEPVATDNLNSVAEDDILVANGNVITDDDGFFKQGSAVDFDIDNNSSFTVTAVSGGDVYGTLTWDADGGYQYILANGDDTVQALASGEQVFEVYTYTITDDFGATDTATLTIDITGKSELELSVVDNVVDEEALPTGTNPTSDAETVVGDINISVDPGASFTLTVGGVLVTLDGNVATETVIGGTFGNLIVRGDSTYEYTLNTPVTADVVVAQDAEQYEVVLNEGGIITTDSLDIDIIDDEPVATLASVNGMVDEDELSLGNPDFDSENTVAVGSVASLVNIGADQPGFFSLDTDFTALLAQGLESDEVALSYSVAGDTLTAKAGAVDVFTLQLAADGSYSFTLLAQLDHPVADGNDNETMDIDLSSVIMATDEDGDSLTLTAGFTITVEDDVPELAGDGEFQTSGEFVSVNGYVDEDELPGGITDNDGQNTVANGSVAVLFSIGADQDGSYSLAADTSNLPALTSGGVTVTYSVNPAGDTLTAVAGTDPVFTLTLADNGDYQFTLEGPLDHLPNIPADNDNQTMVLDLSSIIVATDEDGDSLTLSSGFTITVEDDIPDAVVENGTETTVTLDESPVPTDGDGIVSATGDFSASFTAPVDYGTDGAGSTAYSLMRRRRLSNIAGTDGAGSTAYSLLLGAVGLGSGLYALDATDTEDVIDGIGQGDEILLVQTSTTVVTGSAGGTDYFTLTVDPGTGIVTFAQLSNIWHGNTGDDDDAATLTATGSLELVQTVVDADGDSDSASLDIGTGVFIIEDDGPSITSVSNATVDEDGLLDVSGDDVDTVSFVVDFGTDGASSTLGGADFTPDLTGLTSGGVALVWVAASQQATAGIAGPVIFTMSYDDQNGQYTFDLEGPLDHLGADDLSLDIDFSVTVTDGDGDTASETFTVTVNDSVPNVDNLQNLVISNEEGTYKGTVEFSAGADGLDSFNLAALNGVVPEGLTYTTYTHADWVADVDNIQTDGFIVPDEEGSLLLGTLTDGGTLIFWLNIDSDGQYCFELVEANPIVVTDVDLGSIPNGNYKDGVYYDADTNTWSEPPDPGNAELFISGAGDSINPSTAGIGAANNHFEEEETIIFEFAFDVDSVNIDTIRAADNANDLAVDWELWDGGVGGTLVDSGTVVFSGANGSFDYFSDSGINGDKFDTVVLTGLTTAENSDTDANAKYTLANLQYSTSALPVDSEFAFDLGGTDGDGDVDGGPLYVNVVGGSEDGILVGDQNTTFPDDILVGGLGDDSLTGGLGADVFDFNFIAEASTLNSTDGVGVIAGDVITDLTSEDTIDIADLLADVAFTGTASYDAILDVNDNSNAILQIKDDATVVAEITIEDFASGAGITTLADVLATVDDVV